MRLKLFNKLTYISILLIFFTIFSSCEKKTFSSKDNEKAQILKDLNSSNFDKVIQTLESKEQNSVEEGYLLASAYAMKGGMSVYSLYPLLEIELFHKRALDWGGLDSQKNPYQKFLVKQSIKDASINDKEQAWEDYLKDYKEVNKFDSYDFNCETFDQKEYCNSFKLQLDKVRKDVRGNIFNYTDDNDYAINDTDRRVYEVQDFIDDHINMLYSVDIDNGWEVRDDKVNILSVLGSHYEKVVRLDYKKDLFFAGEKDKGSMDSTKMMNFFWSIYESIPIIQRLPTISALEQDALTKTLNILKENLKKDNTHLKSVKMIVMTLIFSMSSAFADSFDLASVDNPFEMGCHIKEDRYVSYYPLLRARVKFLADLSNEGVLDDKVSKEAIEPVEAYLKGTSDVISIQDKVEILNTHKKYKVNNCDPQIYLQD